MVRSSGMETLPSGTTTRFNPMPRRIAMAGLCLVMMAYAFSVTMIGPLMPALIGRYGLRLSAGGFLETARSIGGVIAVIALGAATDLIPKKYSIILMFAVYTATLFVIRIDPSYTAIVVIFFVLGASTRLVDSVSNAMTADLFRESPGTPMNILHTVFGVGALGGPILARAILAGDGEWQTAYGALAVVCAGVLAVFIAATASSDAARERPPAAAEIGDTAADAHTRRETPFTLLRSRSMVLVTVVMFLYTGHQVGLTVWLPTYMIDHMSVGADLAALAVTLLWAGIIVGRLTAAQLSRSIAPVRLISVGSAIGGVALAAGFVSGSPVVLLAAAFVAGATTGATIPLIVTIACGWVPHATGSASGLIFLVGSISHMVYPWAMGLIAETVSFPGAMSLGWLPLIVAFFVAARIDRTPAPP
ncbi:MAG: MFS transporter [Spirochaetaceae bacterium]|nr:MAG: MFS transporter [Spirochaetaceae bacterium]